MRFKGLIVILTAAFMSTFFIDRIGLGARYPFQPSAAIQQEQKFYPSRYFDDEQVIEEIIKKRDLHQLLSIAAKVEEKYARDIEAFSQLLSRIANALSSYEFGDDRQYLYSEEIARKVLSRSDEIPIETELEMLRQLLSDSKYVRKLSPVSEWPADRAQRLSLLIHLVKRFNAEIDRGFDLKAQSTRPVGNVCPGAGYLCGIAAEQIKQPEIRAKYVENVEANIAKGRKYNQQHKLRQMDKELAPFVDRFLVSAFGRPPFDNEALERSLAVLGIEGARKDAIVARVLEAFQRATQ